MKERPTYPEFRVDSATSMKREHDRMGLFPGQNFSMPISLGQAIPQKNLAKNHSRTTALDQFATVLFEWFGEYIYKNVGIYSNGFQAVLCPDFLFYYPELNFHLSIEIHEPYDLNTKEPTHWISSNWNSESKVGLAYCDDSDALFIIKRDKNNRIIDEEIFFRTNEFSSQGWYAIRFSERQAILLPNECCKYIADKIRLVTGILLAKRTIDMYDTIIPEPRWTLEEAVELATNDYRKQYLLGGVTNTKSTIKGFSEYQLASSKWRVSKGRDNHLPF